MENILLLEDDPVLSKEISQFLDSNDFKCDCVYDGSLASKQAKLKEYDLAVLDINVPGMNGLEVCQLLRQDNGKMPILMLTAYGEIEDKMEAYNKGADDYLVKPFHLEELLIRIKSLLRRKDIPQVETQEIEVADLRINTYTMQVFRAEKEVALSPKEFKLLSILAKANGRVLSKMQIADELWDFRIETNQNTIEVYINFLRKKIDKDFEQKLIHTKVGYGYYLKDEA
ncbi:response regulator transcription factor [Marinilongibacter aquaticus]|uniref:response regulator transcription factor n=1 Tax=Marinilongibacter aquaticus TaxID=2975157 RepID=UPI0021BD1583|nr:response regulator transcription factor [Marinilongibacter aquaticus]UBM58172.1 response regulator transcription factor [Marinilongibacter aquaticus]